MEWHQIVHAPYGELNWREAERIVQLFIKMLPERVKALEADLHCTGSVSWKPDLSDGSLLALGEWAKQNIRLINTKPHAVQVNPKLPLEVQSSVRMHIEADWHELSYDDECRAMDIGLYMAECIRHRSGMGVWRRCKRKRSVDYNYPVLWLVRDYEYNPYAIGGRAVVRMLEGNEAADKFVEKCGIWSRKAKLIQDNETQQKSRE